MNPLFHDTYEVIRLAIQLSLEIKKARVSKRKVSAMVYLDGVTEADIKEYCFAQQMLYETGTDGKTRDYFIRKQGAKIASKKEAFLRVDLTKGEHSYDGMIDLIGKDIPIIEPDNED